MLLHCKRKLYQVYLLIITSLIFLFVAGTSHARPFGAGNLSSQISSAVKKQVRAAIVPVLKTKYNKIEYPKQMLLSADNRYLAMLMEGQYISVWDMEKGKEIDHINTRTLKPLDFAIDARSKKIYVVDDKGVLHIKPMVSGENFNKVTDRQGKQKFNAIRKQNISSASSAAAISKNNQAAQSLSYNGGQYQLIAKRGQGILVMDGQSEKKKAQLLSTKNGWAVLDAQGRYDGNEEAFKDVSWDADGQLLELDRFSEKYFEPGLLTKVMRKKSVKMITRPVVEIEKGIYLPPQVTLKILSSEKQYRSPDAIKVQVLATLDDKPEVLHDLKFFHNGKRVPKNRIHQKKSYTKDGKGIKEWQVSIVPEKGRNKFSAEVSGWQDIIGQARTVSFNVRKKPTAKATRFFMKSIGINQYQGSKLLLDFAVADAREIFKTFSTSTLAKKDATGKYKQNTTIRTLMLDKQASKKEILNLFDVTQLAAKKNDLLVVFMSGHGMVVDNQWYYLPQEAKSLTDAHHVRSVGVSASELMDKFVEIPSQKIVLIIDACQSGAATRNFNNFHQRRALRGLSRNTGIHIIAATRADQLAPEFAELGHGLFTYTLLNGMKKNSSGYHNADLWPKDGQLMVSELQKFAEKFVPALAYSLASRHSQSSGERGLLDERTIVTPVGSSQGQDFIVYQ